MAYIFTLLFVALPALAFGQVDTSTGPSDANEVYQSVRGVLTAFDVGVLAGIEAILAALVVLLRFEPFKELIRATEDGILDFVPPLSVMLLTGFTAGYGVALSGGEVYMAVVSGLLAVIGTAPFTSFMREIAD